MRLGASQCPKLLHHVVEGHRKRESCKTNRATQPRWLSVGVSQRRGPFVVGVLRSSLSQVWGKEGPIPVVVPESQGGQYQQPFDLIGTGTASKHRPGTNAKRFSHGRREPKASHRPDVQCSSVFPDTWPNVTKSNMEAFCSPSQPGGR